MSMPYSDLPYSYIGWAIETEELNPEMKGEYTSGMDFSNFDEESFLDSVCREYSDPYLRFRKFVFVLTERAIFEKKINFKAVVNLAFDGGLMNVRKNIESLFGKYRKSPEQNKSDLIVLGLVYAIYDSICFESDLEETDMKKIYKKMLLPITIAYFLCENKMVIEKIFDFKIRENAWKVKLQKHWLRVLARQYMGCKVDFY